MVEELHPRRLAILRFLARREAAGEHPSTREIGAGVGLSSTQTVYHHLRHLESGGLVERRGKGAKSIRLIERGWQAVGEMPLMGQAAAGRGLEAVTSEESYALAAEMLAPRAGRQRYLLRVVGQSMTGAGIEDGDLLVIEEEEDPAEGEIVVALLAGGEEVTIKRLYREGENVRLRAQNGEHENILVPAEDVTIQGRVEYVIHRPRR
jgi:repressor LexA